ncbi:DUF2256 domain-containing protein [Leeuwenhoekiella polynyae]|uniref:DUF2256 domain-containing protein n=1 Tax=Leeuwenhoekiella polynyae TaxID=1550906 RepID=UPI00197E2231|nr:DUF2256 domain-containing protein [Leeuwenhoekiella polynyae]
MRLCIQLEILAHKKVNLPQKICLTCEKPFTWRKKWEKKWQDVTYCSERCRRNKKTL